jgi:lipid-A-disaccharide synthase-like uncharacterized protein
MQFTCSIPLATAPLTFGEWAWFIFGMTGNVVFGSRFFIQWLHSERHKESRVPEIFWWLSVVGTLILFVYFLHKHEWVGLAGNCPNIIPYTRNLVLIYRKKRHDAKAEGHVVPDAPVLEHADGSEDTRQRTTDQGRSVVAA